MPANPSKCRKTLRSAGFFKWTPRFLWIIGGSEVQLRKPGLFRLPSATIAGGGAASQGAGRAHRSSDLSVTHLPWLAPGPIWAEVFERADNQIYYFLDPANGRRTPPGNGRVVGRLARFAKRRKTTGIPGFSKHIKTLLFFFQPLKRFEVDFPREKCGGRAIFPGPVPNQLLSLRAQRLSTAIQWETNPRPVDFYIKPKSFFIVRPRYSNGRVVFNKVRAQRASDAWQVGQKTSTTISIFAGEERFRRMEPKMAIGDKKYSINPDYLLDLNGCSEISLRYRVNVLPEWLVTSPGLRTQAIPG